MCSFTIWIVFIELNEYYDSVFEKHILVCYNIKNCKRKSGELKTFFYRSWYLGNLDLSLHFYVIRENGKLKTKVLHQFF